MSGPGVQIGGEAGGGGGGGVGVLGGKCIDREGLERRCTPRDLARYCPHILGSFG